MTTEEKKEAKRAASNKKSANGSDAEPLPDAHLNKREPKARTFQVSNSVTQLCWWHQAFYNGGRFCKDLTDPKRGCKYTHVEFRSFAEYKSLSIPPEVIKELKTQEKKLAAMGENVPHRPTKPPAAGEAWSQSGGKGKGKRPWSPAGGGKGKDGKSKGKGKDGKSKGKGEGKRKGATNTWGEWADDSNWDDWSNY